MTGREYDDFIREIDAAEDWADNTQRILLLLCRIVLVGLYAIYRK